MQSRDTSLSYFFQYSIESMNSNNSSLDYYQSNKNALYKRQRDNYIRKSKVQRNGISRVSSNQVSEKLRQV